MDQATFFATLYCILNSVHCPLDDDNRNTLISFLETMQDSLSTVCVEGTNMTVVFEDNSEFVCEADTFITKHGKSITELITPLFNALKINRNR